MAKTITFNSDGEKITGKLVFQSTNIIGDENCFTLKLVATPDDNYVLIDSLAFDDGPITEKVTDCDDALILAYKIIEQEAIWNQKMLEEMTMVMGKEVK